MSDPASDIPRIEPAKPISEWKVAVAVMMAGIVIFIGFILLRLVLPTNWAFTVEATTEVVEVKMRTGTEARWLVDGATVCYQDPFKLPENYVVKLPEKDVACPTTHAMAVSGSAGGTRTPSRYCD